MILSRRTLRPSNLRLDSAACLACQWRNFSVSYQLLAEKNATTIDKPQGTLDSTSQVATKPIQPPPVPSPLEDAPRSYGKAVNEFTPKPLSRPIGLAKPPMPGDNAGIDTRSWKQRREDFVNYDKHLIRRKELTQKISTPYFREWSNMRMHKGKSFLAPPGIFKAEKSLFFPNFQGQTLVKDKKPKDTTLVLDDKISVVCVFSSTWAENQVSTFVSAKANPALEEVVKGNPDFAQIVHINVEENGFKALLIRLFMYRLRKKFGSQNWGKYFLIRRGITGEIRDAVGLLNSKVGYIYVLDGDCRIRWAGSGVAEGDEKEGLVKATKRLIEEANTKRMAKLRIPIPPVVQKKKPAKSLESAAPAA